MRNLNGWVKTSRNLSSVFFGDSDLRGFYAQILDWATYQEIPVRTFNLKSLKTGQVITTSTELGAATGLTRSAVFRKMKKLEEMGLITRQNLGNRATLITIREIKEIQIGETTSELPANYYRQSSGTIPGTNKKKEEGRKEKEEINDRPFAHNFDNPLIDVWNEVFSDRKETATIALANNCYKIVQEWPDLEKWKSQFRKLARNDWLMAQGWFGLHWVTKSSENASKVLSNRFLNAKDAQEEASRKRSRSNIKGWLESRGVDDLGEFADD